MSSHPKECNYLCYNVNTFIEVALDKSWKLDVFIISPNILTMKSVDNPLYDWLSPMYTMTECLPRFIAGL